MSAPIAGMIRRRTGVLLVGSLCAVTALANAQGPSPTGGAQGRGAVRGAAQATLDRTADAVLSLKTARFTVKREGTPAFLDEKNGITFTVAECVYAAPDRVSCDVKVALRNGTILQITRVWVPDGTFQSNPLTRQFGRLPADASFNGVLLFARTGIPDVLKTGVQSPQVSGREPLQGREALRLKGSVTGDKINPLIGSTLKADATYPVDLWIDERSAVPMQLRVNEPEGNAWLIELTRVNEPAEIPTPKLPPTPARPPA